MWRVQVMSTADCICPEVQPHGSNPVPGIPEELQQKVLRAWDLTIEQLPRPTAGSVDYWRGTAERHEALAAAYEELRGVVRGRLLIVLCVDAALAAKTAARQAREQLARVDAYENGEQ